MALDTSQYDLLFSEEFDSLSLFDGRSGIWKTEGYWGWRTVSGNGEKQFYVDPTYGGLGLDPFRIEDGALVITAQPAAEEIVPLIDGHAYTSGIITSEQSFSMQYGYFEIRAEMPEGQGLWPAFWMLTADGQWPAEIDVVEVLGHETDRQYATQHYEDASGAKTQDYVARTKGLFDSADGFHTYGVEWNADEVIWYYDGVEIGRADNQQFDQPMYVIANLAVGGYWPGSPDATTPFPAEMKIDYIRIYELPSDHEAVAIPEAWAPIDAATAFSTLDGAGAPSTWSWQTTMADGAVKIALQGDWARYATGNAADNYIRGSNAPYNELNGAGGDDVLEGRGGIDLFVVRDGDGNDTIVDFSNVVGNQDKVRLEGFHFTHFDDVLPWLAQVGADVVLRLDEDQALRLRNLEIDDLSPEQFVFTNSVAAPDGALPITAPDPVEPTPDPVVAPEPAPEPDPVVEPTPDPVIEPEPTPDPVVAPTPDPAVEPTPEPDPVVAPTPEPDPVVEPTPDPVVEPTPEPDPVVEPTPDPVIEPAPAPAPGAGPGRHDSHPGKGGGRQKKAEAASDDVPASTVASEDAGGARGARGFTAANDDQVVWQSFGRRDDGPEVDNAPEPMESLDSMLGLDAASADSCGALQAGNCGWAGFDAFGW